MTGYSREELLAYDALDLMTDKSRKVSIRRMQSWLRGVEPPRNVEYEVLYKDGSVHLLGLDVTLTRDGEGRPSGAMLIARDITERRRAEEQLRLSTLRYRALAEENERLYRQQLDIAENLQFALLNIPSEIGPLRIGRGRLLRCLRGQRWQSGHADRRRLRPRDQSGADGHAGQRRCACLCS